MSSGLVIRTSDITGDVAEFVAPYRLSGDIPRFLENAFVPWFREQGTDYTLHFIPYSKRWSNDPSAPWYMRYSGSTGETRLRAGNGSEAVLDPHSRPVGLAFSALQRLESSRLDLFTTLHFPSPDVDSEHVACGLNIRLPRFTLSFFVNSDGLLECKDMANHVITLDQQIGALHGLRDVLVLRDAVTETRCLIVPFSEVKVVQSNPIAHGHPTISVALPSSTEHIRFFVYDIDRVLGRLIDDGTLTSRLYLIYLHALTSTYTCDTLTAERGRFLMLLPVYPYLI